MKWCVTWIEDEMVRYTQYVLSVFRIEDEMLRYTQCAMTVCLG